MSVNTLINATDFMDSDLLVCPECGEEKTDDGKGFFLNYQCRCDRERIERERLEEEKKLLDKFILRHREDGLSDPEYLNWTFAADDKKRPDIFDLCKAYVENWDEMRDNNMGLLFFGDVGVGKSFYAAAVANAVLDKIVTACGTASIDKQDKLIPVVMTTIPRIINDLQGAGFGGKQAVFDRLQKAELLVIDDLGTERDTSYSLEQLYMIFDARYRSGKPLIVTTNLAPADLKSKDNLSYHRIYDRILQNCIPVKMTGQSRREDIAKRKRQHFNTLLGL